ncbi:MAG: phosphoribosylglycinamide synthetase C domain-containing protein [Verrucomicrobiota bacterium]|nr:phosphoribosylglycinamide synthetase C domain-containing protein [Verrucomicrobiota bacterium]
MAAGQHARVMAFGVGAFTQGTLRVLRRSGASVSSYLTRPYAQWAPSQEGPVFDFRQVPNPCELLKRERPDFVLVQSIDWAQQAWCKEFLEMGIPIFCPTGEALLLERDRNFARQLCQQHGIPFPQSHLARTLGEAEEILTGDPRPYVIKNPLCSPGSPIHTIVCESIEDTRSWLPRLDYAEGVFLQEYMGRAEAGHIAFVSGGEIYSIVTNQEYKRAFNGNMGIVAGAPLGGLIELDREDRYGLARELLQPLLPWFQKTNFHGPVQVTAIRDGRRWSVLEYNVRIGVTSGPMILQLLENPVEVIRSVCLNEKPNLRWKEHLRYGCSVTLAGFGYPYVQQTGPRLPVTLISEPDTDILWNEVEQDADRKLFMTGHRIADVIAVAETLQDAIDRAYRNIAKIRCLGSYYRTDVGQTLWPPGHE